MVIKLKDCPNWVPLLQDTGLDYIIKWTESSKYCGLSFKCKQLDMKSDYCQYTDPITGIEEFDYACTGQWVTEENKRDDEEVS